MIRTDDHTAYFVNDENKQPLQCKTDESLKTELEVLYVIDLRSRIPSWKTKQFFVEQDNLNVKSAYLIEQIPMSFYITQLFTNQSEIRTRGDGRCIQ